MSRVRRAVWNPGDFVRPQFRKGGSQRRARDGRSNGLRRRALRPGRHIGQREQRLTITTFAGDIINSGGTGIQAGNQATNASSLSQISITARGNINSGYNMSQGGGQPGGIWAGYTPGGVQTANANVAVNVSVDSGATINSASGVGIGLYNCGAGNITATLQSSNSITAAAAGLNIFAQGGGNVL